MTLYKILTAFPIQFTLFSKMASTLAIELVVAGLHCSLFSNVNKRHVKKQNKTKTCLMVTPKPNL